MDKIIKTSNMSEASKEVITKEKFEDGSSIETRIEEVQGGWIITKETYSKEGEWKIEKSVSTTDPNLDKSSEGIASRLAEALKNIG